MSSLWASGEQSPSPPKQKQPKIPPKKQTKKAKTKSKARKPANEGSSVDGMVTHGSEVPAFADIVRDA